MEEKEMAVKIRLRRMGQKKAPFYRIIVADSRSPRDGRFIDEIGTYDPNTDPSTFKIDEEKAKKWLTDGAQPTEVVGKLFKAAGIELKFEGEGINEKGICISGPANLIGKTLVEVSEDFYRPTDVVNLLGDPTKARQTLGWNPQKTSFDQLVTIMVKHDMEKVAAEHVASVMRTNLAEYLEKGVVK